MCPKINNLLTRGISLALILLLCTLDPLVLSLPTDAFYDSLLGNYTNFNETLHPYHPSDLIRFFHNSPRIRNLKFKAEADKFNITQNPNSLFNGYTRGVFFLPIFFGVLGLLSLLALILLEEGYFDFIGKFGPTKVKKAGRHKPEEVNLFSHISHLICI